jgi:hypothetical protein
MGLRSSSTCVLSCQLSSSRHVAIVDESYQKCAADHDEDTAALVAGLRVDSGNLVLNAREGKLLYSHFVSAYPVLPVL